MAAPMYKYKRLLIFSKEKNIYEAAEYLKYDLQKTSAVSAHAPLI